MVRDDSSVRMHEEGRRSPARRRALVSVLAFAIGATALLIGPSTSVANHVPRACTTNSQQGTLCVSKTDTPDPVSYSTFDGNDTFISYLVTVTNASRSSSLSHVTLTDALPAGTTFVRATPSRGSCSAAGGTVSCTFGSLKKGQNATIEIVVTAPATSDPNPPDQVITNTVTAAFDERFNDQTGGRQDTVSYSETTTVSKSAGQTYIPQGESGQVNTDPSQPQYGNTAITNASTDVLAKIKVLPADNFCILGQVTIQGTVYVCRNGGWFEELVTTDAGQLYSNQQNPVVKHLRWGQPLTSFLQTEQNFVVFDQATDKFGNPTGGINVIGANGVRCQLPASGPPTNMPCITNVTHEPDGAWSVDYYRPDDRRMR